MKENLKLNLGCGKDIKKGYLNLDFEKLPGVDKIYDLNKIPYPFKKNSFKEILMRNILEHLNNPYEIMNEIWRISKPNATIKIRVPHFSSCNVWGDLQHKRGFNFSSFTNPNITRKFKVISQKITFSHIKFFMRFFTKVHPLFYEKHLAYIFPAVDLVLELKTIK